jgi:transposase
MLSPADLPNDINALKALLLASECRIQERDEQSAGLREQLSTRAVEIEHLKLLIAKLRRMQFGRKSEKLDHQIEQLELQLEDLEADEGGRHARCRRPSRRRARNPCASLCPSTCLVKVYAPEVDACPSCGGGLRHLATTSPSNLNSCRPASA